MMRTKCVAADVSRTHRSLFVPSSDKATHPTNRQEDWEYIIGFCDQINKELEGYVCVYMIKCSASRVRSELSVVTVLCPAVPK